jgi:hypothetical protein
MKVYFALPCFTPEREEFKKKSLEKLAARLARISKARHAPVIAIMDPSSVPDIENDVQEKVRRSKDHVSRALRAHRVIGGQISTSCCSNPHLTAVHQDGIPGSITASPGYTLIRVDDPVPPRRTRRWRDYLRDASLEP